VRIAGHVLRDIQPIAKVTGRALDTVLRSIDAEFQSGTWQEFFGFMERNAGPDLRLLGSLFVNLLDTLPPLVENLQPVAIDLLNIANGAVKLADYGTQAVNVLEQMNNAMNRQSDNASFGTKVLGIFGNAIKQAGTDIIPSVPLIGTVAKMLGLIGKNGQKAAPEIKATGQAAAKAAPDVQSLAYWVGQANRKYSNSLSTLTQYTDDLISQADALAGLKKALKDSHDKIGLNTQAQRDSFRAAQTYIENTSQTAVQAFRTGKNVNGAITAIKNGLPTLENAKTKNKHYWQEVKTLVHWLGQLETLKLIKENVVIHGTGRWVAPPGRAARPGFAAGGRIPGYGGGDIVPILAEPGEAIIDKHRARLFAPVLRSMGVPGFASGGIVPRYDGPVKGLQPWGDRNWHATIAAITAAIANAMSRSLLPPAGGGLGRAGLRYLENLWMQAGGPGGYIARIAAAIALAESGGNRYARGPYVPGLGRALGYWQILGQVVRGNIFDPFINALNAVSKFDSAHGFSPWVTYETGAYRAFMDRGGWIYPGTTVVTNNTGRPERVLPPGDRRGLTVNGPLIGSAVIREDADAIKMANKLDFKIVTSWSG
jgi:hypothetical protein